MRFQYQPSTGPALYQHSKLVSPTCVKLKPSSLAAATRFTNNTTQVPFRYNRQLPLPWAIYVHSNWSPHPLTHPNTEDTFIIRNELVKNVIYRQKNDTTEKRHGIITSVGIQSEK